MSKGKNFEWSTVRGTLCIIWNAKVNSSTTKSKKNILKKEKDQLGNENLNVPILDTKCANQKKEICDILVYSDDLKKWEAALQSHYGIRLMDPETICNGYQRVILDETHDKVFVTVNFYKTNKMMVQAGDQKENNLLIFLKEYPVIQKRFPIDNSSNKDKEEDTVRHNSRSSSVPGNNSSPNNLTKKLVVNLPVVPHGPAPSKSPSESVSEQPVVGTMQKQTDEDAQSSLHCMAATPPDSKIEDPKLVINEVLCFLQNWSNHRTHDTIVKLSCSFFTVDEITHAKEVLFNCVSTTRRKISRKGADKSKLDIQDMLVIFLELAVPHSIIFVAQNLSRIPPRDRDNFDFVHATKELDDLKHIVMQLGENQKSILKVINGNASLQPTTKFSKTREIGTETTLVTDGDTSTKVSQFTQTVHSLSRCTHNDQAGSSSSETRASSARDAASESVLSNPSLTSRYTVIDSASITSDENNISPRNSTFVETTYDENNTEWAEVLGRHREARRTETEGTATRRAHTKRRSGDIRRISGVKRGSAPITYIEAVPDSRGNRQCTGLFVSRLKPNTSCAQLAVFIHREWGYMMRPEKIPAKTGDYCSFYIRCNREKGQVLIQSDVWPKGAVVKPFYSY